MALPIVIALAGMLGGAAVSMACFGPGTGDLITNFLNETFQAKYYSSQELLRAFAKQKITEEQLNELMKPAGFSPDKTKLLKDSYFEILNPVEVLTLYFRYKDGLSTEFTVNEDWLKKRLSQAGIEPDNFKEYLEANRPIPSLQDIITFAVKDVYEPEQVALAGLMEDLPAEYVKEARERGLNESDANKFWAAHWALPGMVQVYEMFHRLYPGADMGAIFKESDMDTFFKLADIAPGFRDQLKAISYNPIGRVDIRRFWRTGIYERYQNPYGRLVRDYRQLGYKPEDAKLMADFTVALEGEGRRKLTASQITKFYNEGILADDAKSKAMSLLIDLGYDEQNASLLLEYSTKQFIDETERAELETLKTEYVKGIIPSESVLRTKLAAIPLLQTEVEKQVAIFNREVAKEAERFSKSELQKLYKGNVISDERFRLGLSNLGYTDEDIDLMLRLYNPANTEATKLPDKDDVLEWFSDNLISTERFIEYMRLLGFEDTFIYYYIKSANDQLEPRDLEKLLVVKEDDYA